ncbi:unnamed protein product [Calypogeia fissa]
MAMASTLRPACSPLGSRTEIDIAAMALTRHANSPCVLGNTHHQLSASRSASSLSSSRGEWLYTELSMLSSDSASSWRSASLHSRENSRSSTAIGCRCLEQGAWFEFSSEGSSTNAQASRVGDFKILSHLQQLGCGELTKKPQEVYFPGCMNESYAFHCTGGNYFVKINRRFDVDSMFVGELEALKMMKATNTIRVPAPLGCGSLSDGGSYLIMEHLHFRPFGMLQNSCQEALGRSMAQLHLADVGPSFGFPVQTRLGVLELSNSWSTSWPEFFVEKRLRERLESVYAVFGENYPDIQKKGDLVLEHATLLLKDYQPRPSLLHGDLWMGNSGLLSSGEVAIYDPATFIGDSEFDLAFQGWTPSKGFPGLLEGFYRTYHELMPRAPGFEQRHLVYQLYHLLNHLFLYRVEYFQHVMAAMDKILKG